MLQFKDDNTTDLKQSEDIKAMKEDFNQALCDVKPVSVLSSHVI